MKRNINKILSQPEYNFIKTEPRLVDKIALLTFGVVLHMDWIPRNLI